MKKIYLKELKEEELREIIINNEEFLDMYKNRLYEDKIEMQWQDCKCILGTNYYNYIDVIDRYSSFYMRIRDYIEFIDNLDKDYLSADVFDSYELAIKTKEKLFMEVNEDKQEELECELEELCNTLLADIEKLLHSYKEYPSDNETYEFIVNNCYYEDYYTDSEKKIIYEDIVKVYK